jgi:hypothetical protein
MNRLTAEEIRFFKREGYLVKRGVLDQELMARARERKWVGAPERMKRNDPTTWFGPFRPDEEHGEEADNCRIGYTWKYREPAHEPWIVAMLATNPVIFGWAEQLLGPGQVEPPERIRGIYCRLPMGDEPPQPTVCHCDVTPDRLHSTPLTELLAPGLGVVGLIDHVPPSGGAFTVWPGTHRIIHDLVLNTEGLARNDAYKKRIIEFNGDRRVEGHGAAGDILFWHRLLAHTAGWNRSPQIQLRESVLADYQKRKNLGPKAEPSFEDMWQGWSHEVRSHA